MIPVMKELYIISKQRNQMIDITDDVQQCVKEEKIKHIHIKGKPKKICQECIAAIKGFA